MLRVTLYTERKRWLCRLQYIYLYFTESMVVIEHNI